MSNSLGTPDWIAKDCLDVGLFTNQLDAMLAFWQGEVGLTFDHMLPVGGGVRQHRHDFEGAVLKLNHTRKPLPSVSRGGYRRLTIAKDNVTSPIDLVDPDGNSVRLVPKGFVGITHWAIEVAVSHANSFRGFYEACLGLPRLPHHPLAVRCGRSLIIGQEAPEIAQKSNPENMQRCGFRYTTLQVDRVDPVHRRVIEAGGQEGAPPRTLGETARISFIKDHHGNWMELSQRASITGTLEAS